jgi:hypothetical protein
MECSVFIAGVAPLLAGSPLLSKSCASRKTLIQPAVCPRRRGAIMG